MKGYIIHPKELGACQPAQGSIISFPPLKERQNKGEPVNECEWWKRQSVRGISNTMKRKLFFGMVRILTLSSTDRRRTNGLYVHFVVPGGSKREGWEAPLVSNTRGWELKQNLRQGTKEIHVTLGNIPWSQNNQKTLFPTKGTEENQRVMRSYAPARFLTKQASVQK